METSNIQTMSSNLSYAMKQFSGSVKSAYGTNESSNEVDKDMAFNLMMSSFKTQVSLTTYDNLNNQGSFLERLGISSTGSKGSSILSEGLPVSSDLISSPFSSSSSTKSSENKDDLFGENGYWGIKKTASRISDFVMSGAGDDIEKLKAGREGIQRGLKDAEKVWGGQMPDIAYQTIDKSLEAIDEKIKKLGGNIVDISA